MHRLPLVAETPLTEFVPSAQERIAGCVARLLGVPSAWRVSIAERPSAGHENAGWRVCVALERSEGAPLKVEVRAPDPGAQGFFLGQNVVLAYRKGPRGEDPWDAPDTRAVLETLRDRVREADREGLTTGPLARFHEEFAGVRGYAELDDRMFRYATAREAIVRLGFRCNQRCDFCWQHRDWPEATVEHYTRWIDEFARAGVREIHFTGGEPTIHPALPSLIEHATRAHGMDAWLQTNAVRLAKGDYLRALVDAGLRGVFASYHAHVAEVSDAMTLAPGTHRFTERGITACLEAGVAVVINTLVERRNVLLLEAHARHLIETFDCYTQNRLRLVSYSHPGSYLRESDYVDRVVPLDEVRPHLTAAVRLLRERGVAVEASGACGFPSCVFHSDSSIEMFTVPELQVPETSPDRVYGRACERCSAQPRCVGLRRLYVKHLGERGIVPYG